MPRGEGGGALKTGGQRRDTSLMLPFEMMSCFVMHAPQLSLEHPPPLLPPPSPMELRVIDGLDSAEKHVLLFFGSGCSPTLPPLGRWPSQCC